MARRESDARAHGGRQLHWRLGASERATWRTAFVLKITLFWHCDNRAFSFAVEYVFSTHQLKSWRYTRPPTPQSSFGFGKPIPRRARWHGKSSMRGMRQ